MEGGEEGSHIPSPVSAVSEPGTRIKRAVFWYSRMHCRNMKRCEEVNRGLTAKWSRTACCGAQTATSKQQAAVTARGENSARRREGVCRRERGRRVAEQRREVEREARGGEGRGER